MPLHSVEALPVIVLQALPLAQASLPVQQQHPVSAMRLRAHFGHVRGLLLLSVWLVLQYAELLLLQDCAF